MRIGWSPVGFAEGNPREQSSECRDGPWSTLGARMFGHDAALIKNTTPVNIFEIEQF
jgi:hypothetical protein